MTAKRDCWADWVARMRADRDQPEHPHWRWRDRVLDNAEPIAGRIVLDVGCGEGLIAFAALERGACKAIFSDISAELLEFCREMASANGARARCDFVRASADDLAAVADSSVDVVTTRSVLIYVSDKPAAFREFARVLRTGGTMSLFEPINRFAKRDGASWAGFDLSAVPEIAAKIRAVYEAIQPPDSDPMLDFDERDLLALAERAGFHPLYLQLEAEIRPSEPMAWETFIGRAGNPRVPSIGQAMEQALTADEREQLTDYLRPLVEGGGGTWRMAYAFLHGVKP